MTWQAIAVFDIDGVIRDVSGSYRRALADTVEHFTAGAYRPSSEEIDTLKGEGCWNNDWEASQELVYRYFEGQSQLRSQLRLDYGTLVDFFQRRYRGPVLEDPSQWTGYISQEPVLVTASYFAELTAAEIGWGFFSGATRGSAAYILEHRIGLQAPLLVAMHDAPGKPDPTGLFQVVNQLQPAVAISPVLYIGDTVADMHTVQQAQQQRPQDHWLGIGILPPHVIATGTAYAQDYTARLQAAGATIVLPKVSDLTSAKIKALVAS
ncbi:MAG: TIGR01548 family HAD-type hydrolase [Leptolyngbya sp. SIO1D8]|nr:TIGR01548 family HAD-type hydrolase [Leptolyngbya sp. SIO1D8]